MFKKILYIIPVFIAISLPPSRISLHGMGNNATEPTPIQEDSESSSRSDAGKDKQNREIEDLKKRITELEEKSVQEFESLQV